MVSKIIKWVDRSLDKVERAAANARAALSAKKHLEEKVQVARSAFLCIVASADKDSRAFAIATEALNKLEDK